MALKRDKLQWMLKNEAFYVSMQKYKQIDIYIDENLHAF